jgi:1,4-dihydroxy-2-naphthoate polyprenyltransferase
VVNPEQILPSQVSRAQAWMLAARPKTLPAAVAPVLIGAAVAFADGVFEAAAASVALLCALLIQIATNLANDYFDYVKGADTEQRKGPIRVVQSGLIPPLTVRNTMFGVLACTFFLGLYLVSIGGLPVLIIGVASLICAVLYTAGPKPLAYIGLGDVFVFLFFGIVAVMGTYFVQARVWSTDALIASLPVGALSTAILVINNYRDIETDRASGKRTLAVRIGEKATRMEFTALLLLAYAVPLLQILWGASYLYALPLASIPLALHVRNMVYRFSDGMSLNRALAWGGRLLALYALFYALAIIFG